MSVRSNVRSLPGIVGRGYAKFWRFKGRYSIVKGSRASKKSKTAALWLIYHIMKYPLAHGLVIRRYWNTHRESTFADLKWAARRLGVLHLFKFPKSEVKITYLPTGQTILFRGCDDVDSITSISVDFGGICFVWFEEAFQITSEEDFDKIDGSIRGGFIDADGNDIGIPPGYFRRIILTFNPWSPSIWIKDRFFKDPVDEDNYEDENILAMTTNYLCNEWLTKADYALFTNWRDNNPRYYRVAGLGHWGITEGLVYENWETREFDWEAMFTARLPNGRPRYKRKYGMDFGYSNDPTACVACLVDERDHEIYVYYEHYRTGESNLDICLALEADHLEAKPWVADNSAPKDIDALFNGEFDAQGMLHRLNQIRPSKKGHGSVNAGIQKLQVYKIVVHPKCPNVVVELSNYAWAKDPKTDRLTNVPIDEFNHAMDALRYACEDVGADSFSFR